MCMCVCMNVLVNVCVTSKSKCIEDTRRRHLQAPDRRWPQYLRGIIYCAGRPERAMLYSILETLVNTNTRRNKLAY